MGTKVIPRLHVCAVAPDFIVSLMLCDDNAVAREIKTIKKQRNCSIVFLQGKASNIKTEIRS